ncbi:MAG: ABC transporter ATP-binding protein [Candidatus Brocadiaceae bacterium]|jgi:subfamily B ATP-binding cassette protein MsbA
MGDRKPIVWKLDTTPSWLCPRLDELRAESEEVRLAFESDMDTEGNYRAEALVVTDRRVLVIEEEGEQVVREIPLRRVALVKVKWLMGSGFLMLTTWEKNLEILRFSSSLSDPVREFTEEFQEYLMRRLAWDCPDQHEESLEHRDEEDSTGEANQHARRCPECGQLLPRDRDVCNACLSKRAVMSRMLAYLKPYKGMVALSLAMTFTIAIIQAAVPRLGRTLIDSAIANMDLFLLRALVIVLAALLFVRAGVAAVRKILVGKVAQNMIYDLRQKVYSHLQKLSMEYHDRQSTGRLISRVVSDTSRLQRFAVGQAQQFVVDVILLAIVLCWMLSYSVPLTLMLWFPLPLYYFLVKWYRDNVHKVLRKAFRLRAAMSGHLADTIPGIEMVKAFSQEERAIGEFNHLSGGFRAERIKATAFSARFITGFMVLTQIGTVLVYWFGGRGTMEGTGFTIGQLVMFIGWIGLMYAPVRRFARITEQFENAATSAERVFDVLDSEVLVSDNPDGRQIESIDGSIAFENVHFSYDSGPEVLKGVSFEVSAGQTVGIVGPSGSGKSTLIKLLCRFYDVSTGRVLIDGHDLSKLHLPSYRRQLSIVGQEPFLFRDSILENIRYGKPTATREEVIRAARVANAHEFIMSFPEAYDTDARERGNRFSGGEKQRICIARAVLKNPNLLILDEATSSVDTKNEKLIQDALDRLIEDRTAFIIAHRLSTLRNADKIIMMMDGQVLDVGPHRKLMKRCKDYRELVEAQSDLTRETAKVPA